MDIHAVKELHDRLQRIFGYGSTINGIEVEELEIIGDRLFARLENGTTTEIVERH